MTLEKYATLMVLLIMIINYSKDKNKPFSNAHASKWSQKDTS